ncbi:phosphodiester glycosidase family protein [bacterium]|nr:phosphodiester glycosidase family protein [bacterium]
MKKFIILLLCILFMAGTAQAKSINIEEENDIYHITLSGNSIKKHLKFVSTKSLKTNEEIHKLAKSKLTINAGFFDPNNEKTISYIVTNGTTVEDPYLNERLYTNPILRENIKKILNRSEFRITECNKKINYSIVPHNTPVDFSCNILTSAQGGPQLLPDLRLEEEFFILKDSDNNIIRQSASVLDRTARTLIGIKDDEVHILIITNKNPKNIFEARDLCKSLGLQYAMAFDGGSSTSLDYKKIHVTSTQGFGEDTGRRLKSFMIITPKFKSIF